MEIQPAFTATSIIQFFLAMFVLIAFALSKWWGGERKMARSLRESSQLRCHLIDVQGPMTKAAAELAARQDRAPSVQSEEQSKESSLADEAKAVRV